MQMYTPDDNLVDDFHAIDLKISHEAQSVENT